MSADFNPNSTDAVLAKIMTTLEGQNVTLAEIREGVAKTNGRVNILEHDKWYQRGFAGAIGISGAVAIEWLKQRFDSQ